MATGNPRNIRRFRGRLAWNPTDLTAAFPHGGTELGLVRDLIFRFGIETEEIRAEEWGNIPTEYVYKGSSAFLAAFLREFDNDAIGTIFPDAPKGSATGDQIIRGAASGAGVTFGGVLLSTVSGVLVVSPDSPERQEFLLLYNAFPMPEETAELQISAGAEVGMAVVFRACPDSTDRMWNIGKRRDLSL